MNKTFTLYFFKEGISFPVMLVALDEWEKTQISYLDALIKDNGMTTKKICRLCENHNIKYGC